LILKT